MKSCRKSTGYTLVELIVTLVILAVLAALLMPALTGYIDKAQEAAVIAEARAVLTASQATVTEAYAQGKLTPNRIGSGFEAPKEDGAAAYRMAKQIFELSEMNCDECDWWFSLPSNTNTGLSPAKISLFTYCNKRYCITYRVVATDSEPAGWGAVVRASEIPAPDLTDGTIFLSSESYKPEKSEPPDTGETGGTGSLTPGGGSNPDVWGGSESGQPGEGTNPDGPDLPGGGIPDLPE